MGRRMPFEEIPDSNVVPGGIYPLKALKLEETESQTGKLMYKLSVQIMDDPKVGDYSGMVLFEQFTIGNDDDLKAEQVDTWKRSFGAKMLKQLIAASQIAERNDLDKICANFADHQFLGNINYSVEKEGPYAGTPRNRINSFFAVGSREVGIDPKSLAEYKGGGGGSAPKAVPQMAPQAPQPAAPAQPSMPQTPPPHAQPQMPQQPQPMPAPSAPQTPPAPQPVAAAPAGPAMACQLCGQTVPMAQFAQHMKDQHGVA